METYLFAFLVGKVCSSAVLAPAYPFPLSRLFSAPSNEREGPAGEPAQKTAAPGITGAGLNPSPHPSGWPKVAVCLFQDMTRGGRNRDFKTYRNVEEARSVGRSLEKSLGRRRGPDRTLPTATCLLESFPRRRPGVWPGGTNREDFRGRPGRLYKNLGPLEFTDVTGPRSALDKNGAPFYYPPHGCAVARLRIATGPGPTLARETGLRPVLPCTTTRAMATGVRRVGSSM